MAMDLAYLALERSVLLDLSRFRSERAGLMSTLIHQYIRLNPLP
jgi:hypothetical protein